MALNEELDSLPGLEGELSEGEADHLALDAALQRAAVLCSSLSVLVHRLNKHPASLLAAGAAGQAASRLAESAAGSQPTQGEPSRGMYGAVSALLDRAKAFPGGVDAGSDADAAEAADAVGSAHQSAQQEGEELLELLSLLQVRSPCPRVWTTFAAASVSQSCCTANLLPDKQSGTVQ